MTPLAIARVQHSWMQLRSKTNAVIATFYECLFDRDPSLRAVFLPQDLHVQTLKMQTTLNMAIGWLHAPDIVEPTLQELGARHAAFGVMDEHFQTASSALLDAVAIHLGADFDVATQDAWQDMLTFVGDVILPEPQDEMRQAA